MNCLYYGGYAGHDIYGRIPWVPVEKSANLPRRPAIWRMDGVSHHLWQLFPCYQDRRPRLDKSNRVIICDLRIGLSPGW